MIIGLYTKLKLCKIVLIKSSIGFKRYKYFKETKANILSIF